MTMFSLNGSLMRKCPFVIMFTASVLMWVLFGPTSMKRLHFNRDIQRYVMLLKTTESPISQRKSAETTSNLGKKVLILGYHRSGSTLTGSIFDDNNDSFYEFEPLSSLHLFTIDKNASLKYFNGSVRHCPLRMEEIRYVSTEILSAIFTCRFEALDIASIQQKLCAVKTRMSSKFCSCISGKTPHRILKDCIPPHTKRCLQAKYRVIKTIRADITVVSSLLKRYPDLKVIHQLRDPRGRICSRLVTKECNISENSVRDLCEEVTRDVQMRQTLAEKHRTTFQEMIYEDLIADPIGVAERLFKFVGSTFPTYQKEILQGKTRYGGRFDGHYGTYRKNSLETAYRWRTLIPWDVMMYVNRHCLWLLEHGKFPIITKAEDLKTFDIPDRRAPDDFITDISREIMSIRI